MVFEVCSRADEVILSSETGSDGTLTDETSCMSDGSLGTSCVEVKAAQGLRIEWPHTPGAMSSVTIRIGINSTMADGTNRLAPYDTSSTIDNTNGVTTVSLTDSGTPKDVDTSISAAFVSDCLTTEFTYRQFENGSGAKTKTAEAEVEATIATIALTGVTKDDDDVIDDLMPLTLLRRVGGSAPFTWVTIDTLTSTVTTGAYTFNYEDDGSEYRVFGQNTDGTESDITPEVQGV